MELVTMLIVGLVLVAFVVGLFSVISNPRDVDQEEEEGVLAEQKQKRRWWRR